MVVNSYNGENGEQICFGRTNIQLINIRKYRINVSQARKSHLFCPEMGVALIRQ